MDKIVFLPLDERPCNLMFIKKLFTNKNVQLIIPNELSKQKKPADIEKLEQFVNCECKNAKGLVVSLDMLLYGGLIPSRLHRMSEQEIVNRLKILKKVKQKNPNLMIYGFQTIMRCPKTSSAAEEPEYYGECGHEIWCLGEIIHKVKLGLAEKEQAEPFCKKIKDEYLKDYLTRRETNLQVLMQTLHLVKENIFDCFVIPQDDSSRYGFTAMDQQKIREKISEYNLETQVLIYPGADEVGSVLMARMILNLHGKRPKVYLQYSAHCAPSVVPLYEDRTVAETLKYQILAAGCQFASCESEADFILAVNCPSGNMQGAYQQPCMLQEYTVERSLAAFVLQIKAQMEDGRYIAVADIAFGNGGDLELIKMLSQEHLLMKLAAYAGWNTSSNTIGTTIAQAVCFLMYGNCKQHKEFLLLRYLEDAGYCSYARRYIYEHLEQLGYQYFDTKTQRGEHTEIIKHQLEKFCKIYLSSIQNQIQIKDCYTPWNRFFEIGIDVAWIEKE